MNLKQESGLPIASEPGGDEPQTKWIMTAFMNEFSVDERQQRQGGLLGLTPISRSALVFTK